MPENSAPSPKQKLGNALRNLEFKLNPVLEGI